MDALNSMTMFDTLLMILISIILIVGVYQFYFFPQNHPLKEPRELSTKADDKIPFIPDYIFHCAGTSSVYKSMKYKKKDYINKYFRH